MNLTDSIRTLDQLGPARPPTPAQIARLHDLTADQPDQADLLAAMGIGAP